MIWLLLALGMWLLLVTALFVGLFLFSLWWVERARRQGLDPAEAMGGLHRHPLYRAIFASGLVLLAPIYLPVRLLHAWQRWWAWQRAMNRLKKQTPAGIIGQQQGEGGKLMVFANLTVFPDQEQEAFLARLEGGECPEQVFADIEKRFAVYREKGR